MSPQLTLSACLSTLAMAALALLAWASTPPAPDPRAATAHGSVMQVLLGR